MCFAFLKCLVCPPDGIHLISKIAFMRPRLDSKMKYSFNFFFFLNIFSIMFNGGKFSHNYCINTNYKFFFLTFSQNTKKEKKKYYKKNE